MVYETEEEHQITFTSAVNTLFGAGVQVQPGFNILMAGKSKNDDKNEGKAAYTLGVGTPGLPQSGKRGIYEFFDQFKQKWYVGGAWDEDILTRTRSRVKDGTIDPDSFYWTEIDVRINGRQSRKGIRVAEQIRIEQVSEIVGGRSNMANDPFTNAEDVKGVINWFEDKWNTLPGWPDWLKNPY